MHYLLKITWWKSILKIGVIVIKTVKDEVISSIEQGYTLFYANVLHFVLLRDGNSQCW
jgi:hypothetical protein